MLSEPLRKLFEVEKNEAAVGETFPLLGMQRVLGRAAGQSPAVGIKPESSHLHRVRRARELRAVLLGKAIDALVHRHPVAAFITSDGLAQVLAADTVPSYEVREI